MDAEQWNDLADMIDFETETPMLDALYGFMEKRFGKEGYSLVDLGPGAGATTVRLAPLFGSLSLVDFSENILDRALKETSSRGISGIRTTLADLREYVPDVKSDVAVAKAVPVFYRPRGARMMERFASRFCIDIVPTLRSDSMIRKVLAEAGVEPVISIDAELIIDDLKRDRKVEEMEVFEGSEQVTPLVLKNKCLRYCKPSSEDEAKITEIIGSLPEQELVSERYSKIICWEVP